MSAYGSLRPRLSCCFFVFVCRRIFFRGCLSLHPHNRKSQTYSWPSAGGSRGPREAARWALVLVWVARWFQGMEPKESERNKPK